MADRPQRTEFKTVIVQEPRHKDIRFVNESKQVFDTIKSWALGGAAVMAVLTFVAYFSV